VVTQVLADTGQLMAHHSPQLLELSGIGQPETLRKLGVEALTERLVLDGKRCAGVRYSVAGTVREAHAGRAVVVSAGALERCAGGYLWAPVGEAVGVRRD
jgi:choline dehydrogenase-like flavoprotein